jgi:hypothetical protein
VSCTRDDLVFLDPAPEVGAKTPENQVREFVTTAELPREFEVPSNGAAPRYPGTVAACLTIGAPSRIREDSRPSLGGHGHEQWAAHGGQWW